MRYPTRLVGDTALARGRIVSSTPIHLCAIIGYSNGVVPYLLVFETGGIVADGTKGAFTIYISGVGNYALALPNPVDMDACQVLASSTPDVLTFVNGNNQSVQALVAS